MPLPKAGDVRIRTRARALAKTSRPSDLRRRTLNWCRSIKISAPNATRDRKSPIKPIHVNLQRLLVAGNIGQFADLDKPFLVCGRDNTRALTAPRPIKPTASSWHSTRRHKPRQIFHLSTRKSGRDRRLPSAKGSLESTQDFHVNKFVPRELVFDLNLQFL